MKIYHMTLDDKTLVNMTGDSAAEAIGKALDKHRGRTVNECYSGNKEGNPRDPFGNPGWIDYEIPKHEPLPYVGSINGAGANSGIRQ